MKKYIVIYFYIENMINNCYFKVDKVQISFIFLIDNNVELKFVHSQNEVISITMFLSLKSLTENELTHVYFCCLKRRA